MVISWYGQACFKLQSGQKTIIIDPFDKKIGLTPPSVNAEVVLVTHSHYDHNNTGIIRGNPSIVDGPGEYEYHDIHIKGIDSYHDNNKGKERGTNTIYLIQYEGLRVAHMGDLGQQDLTEEQIERLGILDVLFIPVGGFYTINGKEASDIVKTLQPRIAVPMHYKIPNLTIDELEPINSFVDSMNAQGVEAQDKLTIKSVKSNPEEQRTEVFIFKI